MVSTVWYRKGETTRLCHGAGSPCYHDALLRCTKVSFFCATISSQPLQSRGDVPCTVALVFETHDGRGTRLRHSWNRCSRMQSTAARSLAMFWLVARSCEGLCYEGSRVHTRHCYGPYPWVTRYHGLWKVNIIEMQCTKHRYIGVDE